MLQAGIADLGGVQVELFEIGQAREFFQLRVCHCRCGQRNLTNAAVAIGNSSAHRAHPIRNVHIGVSGCSRSRNRSRADMSDVTARQGTHEHLDPGACDTRVTQIKRFQVRQHLQALEPGIGDLAAVEVQFLKLLHAAERFESCIGCIRAEQVQFAQRSEILQVCETAVCNPQAVKIQLRQAGEVRQSL